MQRPNVEIRAEGSDGYVVVLRSPSGYPQDLRRFQLPADEPWNGQAARIAKLEANAYRDGIAEGLRQASKILSVLVD